MILSKKESGYLAAYFYGDKYANRENPRDERVDDGYLVKSQSMGNNPLSFKNSFVLEKCLQPKKPLYADKGEGCTLSNTKCFDVSINGFLLRAFPPQRINTTLSFCSEINRITLSVNHAQPHLECEFA